MASIKTEISQTLPSLLEVNRNNEDAISFRTFPQSHHSRGSLDHPPPPPEAAKSSVSSCKQIKRSIANFLSECRFLPESDRKYLAKARQIQGIIDTDSDIVDAEETPTFEPTVSLVSNRVSIRQSPYLDVYTSIL